ncbi:ketopantoate reductase PanE/ApbA C terminal-domain-containing protein [Filobasidium floriforme]|uniref:ketopantoate reductase PanE/ApbA C terminal-domain-containing protein n=1 Tax=Filobasidium floriforme TaxID=5210 RepID=UPI001E8EA0B4|nr:ketopantoate reductase PanE/ApbA C terminal-domain-containing protein [Filobasidium floriforme]KAH8085800.1 ketopantoate reductase PanE/ApbA C terminal-domain-containing protein [Filobasidium floriforme]
MRIHVLGVGSIGSLVAHHLRTQFPRLPLSLILSRRGLPEAKDIDTDTSSDSTPTSDFQIQVERDGQTQVSRRYTTEYTGPGLQKAHEEVARQGSYQVGRFQLPRLRYKQQQALRVLSTPLTPDDPIESLIVTLKCPDTVPALGLLKHRINKDTCITLLQNGMGVYDELISRIWPEGTEESHKRPRFILGSTTHGVKTGLFDKTALRERDRNKGRKIVHTGFGGVTFGVVPDRRSQVDEERVLFPSMYEQGSASSSLSSPYETILTPPPSPALPIPDLAHPNLTATLSHLLSLSALSPQVLPFHLMHQTLLLKLAVNGVINPLTALFEVKNGSVTEKGEMRRLVKGLCEENSGIVLGHLRGLAGGSAGMTTPPSILGSSSTSTKTSNLSSTVDPSATETPAEPDLHPPILSPEIAALFSPTSLTQRTLEVARSTRENVSSMRSHLKLANGKGVTEVDYINGYLVKLGREQGSAHSKTDSSGGSPSTTMNQTLLMMIKVAESQALSRSTSQQERRERWKRQQAALAGKKADKIQAKMEQDQGVSDGPIEGSEQGQPAVQGETLAAQPIPLSANARRREEYARKRLLAQQDRKLKRLGKETAQVQREAQVQSQGETTRVDGEHEEGRPKTNTAERESARAMSTEEADSTSADSTISTAKVSELNMPDASGSDSTEASNTIPTQSTKSSSETGHIMNR